MTCRWAFGSLWLVPLGALLLSGCRAAPEEKDLWNHVYSSPQPVFNSNPNVFLAEVIVNRRPGMALDLGMGQGRNALFLAQRGWTVTGVDISDVGLTQAREQAQKLGVQLNAVLQNADNFDFGKEKWDLVALLYFPPRPYVSRVRDSLKAGGIVVVEGLHRESPERRRLGEGVVFGTNELLRMFEDFRILRYEDIIAPADWGTPGGKEPARVVRLLAQKN
jgi:SAM-dependent methyltransferase